MDDKEFRAQRARVKKLVDKWAGPLGLGEWNLNCSYSRAPLDGQPNADYTGTETSPALTHAHWQYLDALIEFDLSGLADYDDEHLERIVVHELCHVLINEMREFGKHRNGIRHEERVATQLASAFMRARDNGVAEGKRYAAAEGKKGREEKDKAKGRLKGHVKT